VESLPKAFLLAGAQLPPDLFWHLLQDVVSEASFNREAPPELRLPVFAHLSLELTGAELLPSGAQTLGHRLAEVGIVVFAEELPQDLVRGPFWPGASAIFRLRPPDSHFRVLPTLLAANLLSRAKLRGKATGPGSAATPAAAGRAPNGLVQTGRYNLTSALNVHW
jgi:hypothetical protein